MAPIAKTAGGFKKIRGGAIHKDQKGGSGNQLGEQLPHFSIESKSFKNSIQKPLVHPVISLGKV